MYLIVPPGLLKTIWEGFTNLSFKSSYWVQDHSTYTLTFPWENAVYVFKINTQTKTSTLHITLDNIPKYTFTVYELRLNSSAATHIPEQLTFIVSNTRHEFGDFTLYALNSV